MTSILRASFGFAIACIMASSVAAQTSQNYYFGRTLDRTPVALSMQDKTGLIHFTIPKVYLTLSDNWKGGLTDVIVIEVAFPSMAPLSATRNSTAGADVVAIHVTSHAGGDYHVARVLEYEKANRFRSVGQRSGFEVFEHTGREPALTKELLVPESDANGPVYFECLKNTSDWTACTGHANFGDSLWVDFQFKRLLWASALNIRDATIKLLTEFSAAPKEGRP